MSWAIESLSFYGWEHIIEFDSFFEAFEEMQFILAHGPIDQYRISSINQKKIQ
jgi:hypothetical protein